MGEFDSGHQVKLVVDEWGPWYRPGSELTPGYYLEQTPTLRDAIFSAMTLDIFNRHPEKVTLASPAQLVNCLNSLYLAHEDKFCVTPVGHVFEMYSAHQGGQAVRTIISAPNAHYLRDDKPASFWGLKGSASVRDKNLTLTLVNPSVSEIRETEVVVPGASIKSGVMTVLSNADLHVHNSFDQPNALAPQVKDLQSTGRVLTIQIPPASVTKLELSLM
jgi:alpha-N-arabinofuranosidase